MKRLSKSWNKINFLTRLGLLLSIINIIIAIISKNLLYFIISLLIFLFFIYNARKELERVESNEANKKN
jgi:uncharacterized protein (DUF58 family)